MLRKLGIALAVLVGVLLVAAVTGYAITASRIRRAWNVAAHAPAIPADSAALERGRHLATAIGKCADCHEADFGGKDWIDGGPLGHLYTPNLTRGKGGLGATLTDAQWELAIRHGIAPTPAGSTRSLWTMPSEEFQFFSDEDVGAIIAYLKSTLPVDRELPASHIGPLGRALYLAGQFPFLVAEAVDQGAAHRAHIDVGPTAEYGKYLANVGGCTGCHGPGLSGGHVPGTPPDFKPAANITPDGIGKYTEQDLFRALREAKRPDGSPIDPFMPVAFTKLMTDDEIRAVFAYLKTVPPKPYGGR